MTQSIDCFASDIFNLHRNNGFDQNYFSWVCQIRLSSESSGEIPYQIVIKNNFEKYFKCVFFTSMNIMYLNTSLYNGVSSYLYKEEKEIDLLFLIA